MTTMRRCFKAVVYVTVEGDNYSVEELKDALENSVSVDIATEESENIFGGDEGQNEIESIRIDWETLRDVQEPTSSHCGEK